ncbi:MAG: Gfo/Idh/MocA family oxidoreductase [Acidobacteria bacterium]|nr:MAG: Gfo/Idh/MocA family oxidoreductase [Acidobacteriota bacterium]
MSRILLSAFTLMLLQTPAVAMAQAKPGNIRLAIVGLDHDHVWGILRDIAEVPRAKLVAIADPQPALVLKAKSRVPEGVKFYSDYVAMLDGVKPQAVIITTETVRHLAIVRACAQRHIDVEMEKPMATTAADAREMEKLAIAAHIKLMVNYFNNWLPSYQQLYQQVRAGKVGPIHQLVSQYGHQGPREIGTSREFAAWLYDPVKNGGGALMDFGCYGAALSLWLKGRPDSVFARSLKLKVRQSNAVEDDVLIVLEYPDGTAVLEPSWDWPFTMERIQLFGPHGSLMALPDALLFRGYNVQASSQSPEGQPETLSPLPLGRSNPIAYLVESIQQDLPITGLLSARLNVEVNEILDAARKSIRTGRPVAMPRE